ncbi:MAG: hypothetical protein KC503_25175 [Myxococcales bacterium]|nr:hypothetical protein [Myxococcales bacterium]
MIDGDDSSVIERDIGCGQLDPAQVIESARHEGTMRRLKGGAALLQAQQNAAPLGWRQTTRELDGGNPPATMQSHRT